MSENQKLPSLLSRICSDARYIEGLTYGVPRKGHDEGSVANHLVELEETLERLKSQLTEDQYWKLKILIHVHDTFKLEGKRRTGHQVSIRDPNSHASLARAFLAEFTNDESILAIAQFHDEGFALWQQLQRKGRYDMKRLQEALSKIPDIELYAIFTIIDSFTTSKMKDRSPRWFVNEINQHVKVPAAYKALELLEI